MKYDKKDVPAFKEEVCKTTCIMKGKCINEGQNDHWFLMCPHYFSWKLKLKPSWVTEQLRYDREHPEEVSERHAKIVEKAKAWKESQKKSKKK